MAIKQRKNKEIELIHHSDRGVQYCSNPYVSMLQKNPARAGLKLA